MCCRETEMGGGGEQIVIHSDTSWTLFHQASEHPPAPFPERGLRNRSFLSVRQLVVHTGSQLGRKERERQEREAGKEIAWLSR